MYDWNYHILLGALPFKSGINMTALHDCARPFREHQKGSENVAPSSFYQHIINIFHQHICPNLFGFTQLYHSISPIALVNGPSMVQLYQNCHGPWECMVIQKDDIYQHIFPIVPAILFSIDNMEYDDKSHGPIVPAIFP